VFSCSESPLILVFDNEVNQHGSVMGYNRHKHHNALKACVINNDIQDTVREINPLTPQKLQFNRLIT